MVLRRLVQNTHERLRPSRRGDEHLKRRRWRLRVRHVHRKVGAREVVLHVLNPAADVCRRLRVIHGLGRCAGRRWDIEHDAVIAAALSDQPLPLPRVRRVDLWATFLPPEFSARRVHTDRVHGDEPAARLDVHVSEHGIAWNRCSPCVFLVRIGIVLPSIWHHSTWVRRAVRKIERLAKPGATIDRVLNRQRPIGVVGDRTGIWQRIHAIINRPFDRIEIDSDRVFALRGDDVGKRRQCREAAVGDGYLPSGRVGRDGPVTANDSPVVGRRRAIWRRRS